MSGTTLHAFAHLPIKKQHKCELSSSMLGNFQKSLQDVTAIETLGAALYATFTTVFTLKIN